MENGTDVVANGGEIGGEKRPGKKEREKDEEQYILRLPPVLSKQMRLGLASKAKRDAAGSEAHFSVQFVSEREAFFFLNEKKYAGTLYDLPTILETHKTADKRTYYKSADVHQVLIVRLPEITEETPVKDPEPLPESLIEPYLLNDGIAPASKGAAKRFHIPPTSFGAEHVSNVETHIKWVVDNKVNYIRHKKDEKVEAEDDLEIEVEHEAAPAPATSSAPAKPSTNSSKPLSTAAVTKPAPISTAALPKVPDEPLSNVTLTPPESGPATIPDAVAAPAAPRTKSPSPVPGTPADATSAFPSASGTPLDVGDDDDLDDFANMLGDEIMEDANDNAERRLEITKMEGKIEEQKAKIKQVEDDAAKIPNPVLKKRVLNKLPPLQAELNRLLEERKKLDN